jgi:hypothetical protein
MLSTDAKTDPIGNAAKFFAKFLAGLDAPELEIRKAAIQSAIDTADLTGDVFESNPFRHELIRLIDEVIA